MDDISSTFSNLSIGTSTSDTSVTTNKDTVTVEIGVWNYFSFGAKVAQVRSPSASSAHRCVYSCFSRS